jgi:ribosomal protein RSM22 (predicted rRNA methylase)
MELPARISAMILQVLEMPDLDHTTKSHYGQILRRIRNDMTLLANDFATNVPAGNKYSDAYFIYNFPQNVMKTLRVINEIRSRYPDLLSGRRRYDVLDIGCGEGAGMFGVYFSMKHEAVIHELRLVGIDNTGKMLERARYLSREFHKDDPRLKARFHKQKIDGAAGFNSKKKYDIIIFANSLAEIIPDRSIPSSFMGSVSGRLTDQGVVIIIEPALKKYARRLMELRDVLTGRQRTQVLLPCLHDSHCPMLKLDKREEWCHQSVSWSPPTFLKIINEGLNREIDCLKFSYLVLTKRVQHQVRVDGLLVISQLLKEKGKKRCFLCTPDCRVELVRLNKAKSKKNEEFDRITKGDVIYLEGVLEKRADYWQVTKNTRIDIQK